MAPRAARAGFWLIVRDDDIDLCLKRPGYDVDLTVATSLRLMTQIWMGDVAMGDAVASGKMVLDGAPKHVRAFSRCLKLSSLAGVERPAAE